MGFQGIDVTLQGIQAAAEIIGIAALLYKAVKHAGKIEAELKNLGERIGEQSSSIQKILDDHEFRLRDVESEVDQWRGQERRHGVPDRRDN